MLLTDLVGKVIIRHSRTQKGDALFYEEPCLLLAVDKNKAIVCFMEDTEDYSAGEKVILGREYMDDAWVEFGPLINSACTMRAQLIHKILVLLGINADEESLLTLCRAITYKELYDELRGQLNLDALLYALSPTSLFDESPVQDNTEDLSSIFDTDTTDDNTAWSELKKPSTPKYKGFVRRG